jgi:hypothetical protein
MKTRTLILLALVCGIAILLAGGVFIFNVARNKESLTLPDAREVGTVVEVGPYRAGVLAVERREDAIVLSVKVVAGAAGLADAAEPWSLKVRDLRERVTVAGLPGPDCQGLEVVAGATVECSVAFAPQEGDGRAQFAAGDDQDAWFIEG